MRKRNGFTAWELLAVCAVIAAVGTLMMPSLAGVPVGGATGNNLSGAGWNVGEVSWSSGRGATTSSARAKLCVNNLKQVALGLAQYTQDYDERYPTVTTVISQGSGLVVSGWAAGLQPYVRNTQVFQCPSERHRSRANPSLPGYTDYWLNGQLASRDMSLMRSHLITLMLGDGDGGSRNSDARYSLKALPKSWVTTANSPARRHMNTGCYAFADGHVERLLAKEVGTKAASFAPR